MRIEKFYAHRYVANGDISLQTITYYQFYFEEADNMGLRQKVTTHLMSRFDVMPLHGMSVIKEIDMELLNVLSQRGDPSVLIKVTDGINVEAVERFIHEFLTTGELLDWSEDK